MVTVNEGVFTAKRIDVLTSGGDAPGMNAIIRAVTRVTLSSGIRALDIYDGYKGMVEGCIEPLIKTSVSEIIDHGGATLGPARFLEFKDTEVRNKVVQQLKKCGIEAIVTVGDDGSYYGVPALMEMGISCIGLPGTIDNDAICTDFTIGLDTVLAIIVEVVGKLRDTSSSRHRCSIMGVMRSRCGDLVIWSEIACGAKIVTTPSIGFEEGEVLEKLRDSGLVRKKRHAIVVISGKITDVHQFVKKVSLNTEFSDRATVLGHVQRGGSPMPTDRVLASCMGEEAVDLLMQGVGDQCISIRDNQIVSVPIEETLNIPGESRKRLQNLSDELA